MTVEQGDERAWLAEQYNRRVRTLADRLRHAADDVERRQINPDRPRSTALKTGRCMYSATDIIGTVSNMLPNLMLGDVAATAEEIDRLLADSDPAP